MIDGRPSITTDAPPVAQGFDEALSRLREFIAAWIQRSDREMQPLLEWQFLARSKYFRPVTLFAAHRAVSRRPMNDAVIAAAAAIEMVHNVSLIIDDILDRSRTRRGVLTLHCRFGLLPALMASGFVSASAYELICGDPFCVLQLSELYRRLAVAESLQWRWRRRPLGVEDWRHLAAEDTGCMFEACACLGTRDERLRRFGAKLGMLYHACDDVADVKGAVALGGGGEQDIRDGILTLPAALAIRDPEAALAFQDPSPSALPVLLRRLEAVLPEAERYLDELAADAIAEARRVTRRPEDLLRLVGNTRALSS